MSSYLSNLLSRATSPARGLRPLAASRPVFPLSSTAMLREETIFDKLPSPVGPPSEEPGFARAYGDPLHKPASRYVDVGRSQDRSGSFDAQANLEDFASYSPSPPLEMFSERGQISEVPGLNRAVERAPAPLLKLTQSMPGSQEKRAGGADPIIVPETEQVSGPGTTPTVSLLSPTPRHVQEQVIFRKALEEGASFPTPRAGSKDVEHAVPGPADGVSRFAAAPSISDAALQQALDHRAQSARESPAAASESSFGQMPVRVHAEQPLAPHPTSRAQRKAFSPAPDRVLERAEPVVHITIGRLEVRGSTSAAPPRAEKQASTAPSLEEYLRRRSRGSHE